MTNHQLHSHAQLHHDIPKPPRLIWAQTQSLGYWL